MFYILIHVTTKSSTPQKCQPTTFVANKCDLIAEQMIDTKKGLSLAQKLGKGYVAHVECSAKSGFNVKEVI